MEEKKRIVSGKWKILIHDFIHVSHVERNTQSAV